MCKRAVCPGRNEPAKSGPGYPGSERPSKNLFFDGITALCLSSFGLPSGKAHKETARSGRSVTPDEPAQPDSTG